MLLVALDACRYSLQQYISSFFFFFLLLILLQETKNTGGHVCASDFAPQMVEVLKAEAKNQSLTNIEAKVEDGQVLISHLIHLSYWI